ncbi:MAG: hypothetical protein IPO48_02580 [Saprospiraceae bacterium]|nr:hypothetical protein [Saprospiraceae bacterium]
MVKRITFPRSIDNLGFRLYKFAGIFETDLEESSFENGVIHRLTQTKIEIENEANNVYETIAPFGTLRIAKSLCHIKKKRNEQNFNNNLFRAFNSKLL